jgi:cytochrome c oxidase subunit 2
MHGRTGRSRSVGLLFFLLPTLSFAQRRLQDTLSPAGPQAAQVLQLGHLIFWMCSGVLVAIVLATLWALWHAPKADARTPAPGSLPAEPGRRRAVNVALALSVAGLLVLVAASVFTDRALARLPLQGAVHIELTGHQWWWEARYDDAEPTRVFTTANELHIPVGRPVILTLQGTDVIHSLWVPNLGGKKDLIPGRTTTVTLQADHPGTYRGQCAEFCGLQHAWMALEVVAEDPVAFDAWAQAQRQPAPAPTDAPRLRGQAVFMGSTCAMCHAIEGTDAAGNQAPTLTHVGSRRMLAAGRLPNNAGQMAAWITNPQAYKPGVNMPAHQFSREDLQALVAYLQGLK